VALKTNALPATLNLLASVSAPSIIVKYALPMLLVVSQISLSVFSGTKEISAVVI
jgi:hypothetical protein